MTKFIYLFLILFLFTELNNLNAQSLKKYFYDDGNNRSSSLNQIRFKDINIFFFNPQLHLSLNRLNLFGRNLPAGKKAGILVTLNGLEAPIYRVAPNVITVEVPLGATSGPILVKLPGEAAARNLGEIKILNDDADQDGLPYGWEIAMGLDPNNPHSKDPAKLDGQLDFDGDTLPNADEIAQKLNPAKKDTDNDGLDDNVEVLVLGTLGNNPDTDGDGFLDGDEKSFNSDPKDASSLPIPILWTINETFVPVYTLLNETDPSGPPIGESFIPVFILLNEVDPSGPPIGEVLGPIFTVENKQP